jgi:hypothetical protein
MNPGGERDPPDHSQERKRFISPKAFAAWAIVFPDVRIASTTLLKRASWAWDDRATASL